MIARKLSLYMNNVVSILRDFEDNEKRQNFIDMIMLVFSAPTHFLNNDEIAYEVLYFNMMTFIRGSRSLELEREFSTEEFKYTENLSQDTKDYLLKCMKYSYNDELIFDDEYFDYVSSPKYKYLLRIHIRKMLQRQDMNVLKNDKILGPLFPVVDIYGSLSDTNVNVELVCRRLEALSKADIYS